MKKFIFTLIFLMVLIGPISNVYAALLPFSSSNFIANSINRIVTSNGTVNSKNYSYPFNVVGKAGLTVTGSDNTGTIYLTAPAGVLPPTTTCGVNNGFGKYNQTSNTFTCVLLNQTGSGSGVSSLNALTGALSIAGTTGNVTAIAGGTTITINTAWNIVTTGGAAQVFTKSVTFNNGITMASDLTLNANNLVNSGHKHSLDSESGILTDKNGTFSGTLSNLAASTITQSGHTYTLPANTGTFCLTNQSGTCGTSGTTTTVNSFSGTVNLVRQNGNTTISNSSNIITVGLGVNPVITGGSSQTITKSLTLNNPILGGNLATGGFGLSTSGHLASLPSNTGTICLTNQTGTCGSNNGVTSVNSQTGAITIQGTSGNVTANTVGNTITLNTAWNVATLNLAETFTGNAVTFNNLKLGGQMNLNGQTMESSGHVYTYPTNTGTIALTNSTLSNNINIPNSGSVILPNVNVIRNTASTFGYSLTSSAITANRTLDLPLITQTETLAVKPQINFSSITNQTGTSAFVMLGPGVTITPTVTGRVEVSFSGYAQTSVAGDGGSIDVRQITGSCTANGAAVTGTLIGNNLKMTDAATASRVPFSITVQSTGLTIGQKYCFTLSQHALTGGTFTIFNVMGAVKEL